jgi:hypothetical protein
MPIAYRLDKALGCTIAVWQGDVTTRETDRQLMRLSSDVDWPPGPRHLIDGTTIDTMSLPDPELVNLLFEGTNVLRAAVVRPDLLEELRDYAPSVEFTTFTDRAAAYAFLGLDPTPVQAVIDELRHGLSPLPS